jgi:hypothetical protein
MNRQRFRTQKWLLLSMPAHFCAARQLEAISLMALRELHRETGFLRLTIVYVRALETSREIESTLNLPLSLE